MKVVFKWLTFLCFWIFLQEKKILGTLSKVSSDITLSPPYSAAFFFVVFTVASRVYLSTFSSTGNISSVKACCVRFTSVLQRPGTQCALQKYVMSEWTNMVILHFTDHSFRRPEFYLRRNKTFCEKRMHMFTDILLSYHVSHGMRK